MNAGARVQVGELEDLASPFQRYLLPLQSVWQVLWLVFIVAAVLAALFLFDELHENGQTSGSAWMMIALGTLAGAIPAWIPLLPARFLMHATNPVSAVDAALFVREKAALIGYRQSTSLADGTVLWTRRLQPLTGRENRVLVSESGNTVTVSGPTFAIRRLHRFCRTEFADPR
jgi:hypothetical protein